MSVFFVIARLFFSRSNLCFKSEIASSQKELLAMTKTDKFKVDEVLVLRPRSSDTGRNPFSLGDMLLCTPSGVYRNFWVEALVSPHPALSRRERRIKN